MIKPFIAIAALVSLAGCSALPSYQDSLVGTWEGTLDGCRYQPTEAMAITLRDGWASNTLLGEVRNEIATPQGKKYRLHYEVTGATYVGKVKLEPGKVLQDTSNGMFAPKTMEWLLIRRDTMRYVQCGQVEIFTRTAQ